MSQLDELLLHDKELAQNTSKRIPICLCIDCSTSMLLNGAMNQVKQGVQDFFEKTYSNTLARDAADICIVSFGDTAHLLCDFGKLDAARQSLRENPLRANGAATALAAGVNLALDRLDAHLRELSQVNNNAYVPWLIIISDGDSTEPPELVRQAADRVQKMLRSHDLKTMCLNMGNGSRNLVDFTADGKVFRLDNLRVIDFFDMLSRSVSTASRAAIESGGPDLSSQWNT